MEPATRSPALRAQLRPQLWWPRWQRAGGVLGTTQLAAGGVGRIAEAGGFGRVVGAERRAFLRLPRWLQALSAQDLLFQCRRFLNQDGGLLHQFDRCLPQLLGLSADLFRGWLLRHRITLPRETALDQGLRQSGAGRGAGLFVARQ